MFIQYNSYKQKAWPLLLKHQSFYGNNYLKKDRKKDEKPQKLLFVKFGKQKNNRLF